MTIENPGTAPKLASIQYLRAAAALSVVLQHASQPAGVQIEAANGGVILFFVISGFIMVTITSDRTRPIPFLKDRVRRIVPFYWLATFATVAVAMALGPGYGEGVEGLAASLLFLPYGDPAAHRQYFPVLGVGWTLNYEMMFYVLFALTLFLPRRFQLLALSAVFLTLTGLGDALRPSTAPFEFWTRAIILHFLVGAWMGAAAKPREAGIPGWLSGAGLVCLLILSPITLPAALLLAAAIALERRQKVRSFRLPLFLGNASYSIYLYHIFAVSAAVHLVKSLGLPTLLILPLGLGGGVFAGLLGYKLVEEPLLRLMRRKGSASQAGAPAR